MDNLVRGQDKEDVMHLEKEVEMLVMTHSL